MRKKPTLEQLAARVDALARKVATLDRPARRARPVEATAGGDDLLAIMDRHRKSRGDAGTVAYGGSVALGGREYLWAIERPVDGLQQVPVDGVAQVLAALAHPKRLELLRALLERPRTAAELQAVIGTRSAGPLYHHLKDLLALGIVSQDDRLYAVPARHVVPVLAAVALAVDLMSGRRTDDGAPI